MERSKSFSSQGKKFGCALLSTAYFPPIEYFVAMANSDKVLVEKCEVFQKQSYRTRCHIYGANGLLSLSVPVLRGEADVETGGQEIQTNGVSGNNANIMHTHKLQIDKVRIDYSKPWLLQHKRAMDAAYMTSPFYEYYRDDIFAILDSGEEYLFNLNNRLLELLCELTGISTGVDFTTEWNSSEGNGSEMGNLLSGRELVDFRNTIHPKYKGITLLEKLKIDRPYYQVFSNKGGFIGNLSILDLLCNEGPNSISYLMV